MRPLQPGKAVGELLDGGHADRGGVAAGEQRGPGGRAQRGGVELRQPHAAFGDAAHGRHLHQAAEAVPRRDAGVVPHEIQDVGRILRRGRRGVRAPVRLGIPDVQLDLAVEFRRHGPEITPAMRVAETEKLTTAPVRSCGSATTARPDGIVQPSHAPRPAANHRKCSSLPSKTLSCNGCSVMKSIGVQIRLVMMDSASVALRTM